MAGRGKMQVNLIVKAIAQGFEEVNKKQQSLGKEAEKTQSRFGKAKEGFASFAKGVAGVGAAIGITTIAMKKLFDVAAEGAAIKQQAESFDLLIEKTGATGDILEELRVASRGTVTDFELMSSTATLLAGASGDLAKNLAQNTPQLLEIAKAANKLNPALGSTTFLYDSLARGIKRASPLILDNLGLVIKVGPANEAMAATLGKTVAQLTANEKAQAILNDTMRAGQVLIEQVGGNTESAADSYAKLTTAIGNQADEGKVWLGEFLAPAADALALIITRTDQLTDILAEHEQELIKTANTYDDYVKELVRAAIVAEKLTKVEGDLILEQLALGKGLQNTGAELRIGNALIGTLGENMDRAGIKTEGLFDIIRAGEPPVEDFIERLMRSKEAMLGAAAAADTEADATAGLNGALSELRTLIGSDLVGDYDAMVVKTGELNEKSAELRDEIAELEGTYKSSTTAGQEELAKLRGELDETEGKIKELSAAWDDQTSNFILNMLMQRAAADELTSEEFALISQLAEDWGLIDEGAAAAMMEVDRALGALESGAGMKAAQNIIDILKADLLETGGSANTAAEQAADAWGEFADSEGMVDAQTEVAALKGIVDSIAGDYDIHFNITTSGSIPSTLRAHGGALGPITKVGEQGFEYVIGNQVIPHAESVKLEQSGLFGDSGGGPGGGGPGGGGSRATGGAAQAIVNRETNQLLIAVRDLLEEQPSEIGEAVVSGMERAG